MIRSLVIRIFSVLVFLSLPALADSVSDWQPPKGMLVAQENYDAYDPFADYSEFDEATDEEADIYFFKNGRFFTLGLFGGYRTFTDTMGQVYKGAPNYGILLAYFFDLKFAIQISYVTGDHNFDFTAGGQRFRGTLKVSGFSFDIKYYLNMQNVTKGLADINPYIFGGLTQLSREQQRDDQNGIEKDSAMGFQFGVGTEFPVMRNRMHIGLEAMYQFVNFSGEGNELIVNGNPTNTTLNGDVIRLQAIWGFNF
jgi:hypothetical protein